MKYPKEALVVEYAGRLYEICGEPYYQRPQSEACRFPKCRCPLRSETMHQWQVQLRPLEYVPQPGYETCTITACYVFPRTPAARQMLSVVR